MIWRLFGDILLSEVKDKITPFPISHINLAMLTSEPHFKTNHTPYRAGCLENMAPFSEEGEDHSYFLHLAPGTWREIHWEFAQCKFNLL